MFGTITAIVASITISQIALAATVVGTALSIAGTLTNNSTLKWIGVGIGAAGALTGLAGAAGLFDASTTLGSVFGSGSSASTAGAAASSTVGTVAPAVTTPVQPAVQPAVDAASGLGISQYPTAAGPGMIGTPGYAEVTALGQQAVAPAAQAASAAPPGFKMTEQGMVHLGTPATDVASTTGQVGTTLNPGTATIAPSVSAPTPLSVTSPTAPIANAMSDGSNLARVVDKLNTSGDLASAFQNLDPSTKIALTMAAGQTVAGGLGGVFSSMSTNKQIELQRLIAEQRNNIDSQALQQRSRMLDMEQTKLDRAASSPGIISFGG